LPADTVLVHREGDAVVVEAAGARLEGYVQSFAGAPEDFVRPPQGEADKPEKFE
jgi:virulence-associated protein VagC